MKTRRKLSMVVSSAAMALGVGLVSAPEAIALPDYGYDLYYSSDASHTPVVGEELLSCSNGRHTASGQQTPYYDFNEFPCGW